MSEWACVVGRSLCSQGGLLNTANSEAPGGGSFDEQVSENERDVVSEEKMKINLKVLKDWGLESDDQHQVMLEADTFHQIKPESIQQKLMWLKTDLQQDDEKIKRILRLYPKLIDLSISGSVQPFIDKFLAAEYTKETVIKTIERRPRFLGSGSKYDVTLEFFQETMGMTESEFMRMVLKLPQALGYHINRNLRPKMQYFLDSGFTKEDVKIMIKRCPQIIGLNLDQNIKVKLEKLRDTGFTEPEVHRLIKKSPGLLLRDLGPTVTDKLEWMITELNITKSNAVRIFFLNPGVFYVPLGTWKAKFTVFSKFGLEPEEISALIVKFPRMLQQSSSALEAKCQFAQDALGKSKEQMLVSPRYYTCAFQDSILYRTGFLRYKGRECANIGLGTLAVSTKQFLNNGIPEEFEAFDSIWSTLSIEQKIHTIKTGDFKQAHLVMDDVKQDELSATA